MRSFRRVAVFCGARHGEDPAFAEAAAETGRLLAERGIGVVYGAGSVGLMGVVADAALEAGGEVIGVIPQALAAREIMHLGLTETHVTGSMHERKALMASLSDGFIALPGGFGTLDEMAEAVTWLQLAIHDSPCGFLNVNGFWDPLLAMVDAFVAAGFVDAVLRDSLAVAGDPAELIARLAAVRTPPDRWAAPGAVP